MDLNKARWTATISRATYPSSASASLAFTSCVTWSSRVKDRAKTRMYSQTSSDHKGTLRLRKT